MRIQIRSLLSALAVSAVLLSTLIAPAASSAQAATLDASGVALKFKQSYRSIVTAANSSNPGAAVGDIVKYAGVATIGGIVIDATIETVEKTNLNLSTLDEGSAVTSPPPGSGLVVDDLLLSNVTGTGTTESNLSLKFRFYEGGTYTGVNTGVPVTLKNVIVNSYDLDSGSVGGPRQFTDFKGFQTSTTYDKDASRKLTIVPKTNGLVRFLGSNVDGNINATSGSYSWSRVQVTYNEVTELTVRVGIEGNGTTTGTAYFAVDFNATTTWTTDGTTTVTPTTVNNASNTPPVTSDITLSLANGTSYVFRSADFPYTDADANVFSSVKIVTLPSGTNAVLEYLNGSTWTAVTAGQVFTVADLDLGKLRMTGSSNGSFTFQVNDGLAYSNTGTATFTVASQTQTITFPLPTGITPTTPPFASGATASSGLTVTLTSLTPGVCTVSGLTITPVAAGTCVIEATQAGNGTYGRAQTVTQTFPISALLAQTITFANPGDRTFVSGGSISSGATATSGLTVTLTSLTPSVCSVSGLNIIQVSAGVCQVRASQAGNGTYAPAAPVTQTFTLQTPLLTQTITFTQPADQLLADGSLTVAPTASSGLTVTLTSSSTGVCTVSGMVVTFVSAGTCDLTASQAGNSTYAAASSVVRHFAITAPAGPASQTISFTQPSSQYLATGYLTVAPTASSGLTVTLTSATPSVCTVSGMLITFVTTGTCTIDADQAGNGSYSAAPTVTRSFQIQTLSQTITFTQPSSQYLATGYLTVAPTASSGLTVTLTSATPSVCTVSGMLITFVTTGTCTIDADQAGNGSYSAAPTVTRSFRIQLQTQVISFPRPNDLLLGGSQNFGATSSQGLTVSFVVLTPLTCSISGNVVTAISTGTCTIEASQAGTALVGPASSVRQSFTVLALVVLPPAPTPPGLTLGTTTPIIPSASPARPAAATPTATPAPVPTPTRSSSPSAAATANSATGGSLATPNGSSARRSVTELGQEQVGGFSAGSALRVEVTGARTAAQFVVSPNSAADPVALAAAIKESIARTSTDFARVTEVTPVSSPDPTKVYSAPVTESTVNDFSKAGLDAPRTVSALPTNSSTRWLSVSGAVTGYVPGSRVYLAVTTTPTIISSAIVDASGNLTLSGLLPVDALDAGGHNIRLVGTRQIDGVSADANGNVTLSNDALTAIQRFDQGTIATVVLTGEGASGAQVSAIREVPLERYVAWWTVWLAAIAALGALIACLVRRPASFKRRLIMAALAVVAAIPAFVIGWTSACYELWIGVGIGFIAAAACLLLGRFGRRRDRG